jgi:transposase
MQFAENLTDRQAVDAVRGRIDWKYVLGLELADQGFHYSILSEFRSRLIQAQAEHLLFETMLKLFRDRKLLNAGGRQRTDSTYILSAVRHSLSSVYNYFRSESSSHISPPSSFYTTWIQL